MNRKYRFRRFQNNFDMNYRGISKKIIKFFRTFFTTLGFEKASLTKLRLRYLVKFYKSSPDPLLFKNYSGPVFLMALPITMLKLRYLVEFYKSSFDPLLF